MFLFFNFRSKRVELEISRIVKRAIKYIAQKRKFPHNGVLFSFSPVSINIPRQYEHVALYALDRHATARILLGVRYPHLDGGREKDNVCVCMFE